MTNSSPGALYKFYERRMTNYPSEAVMYFACFWVNGSEEDRKDGLVTAIKMKERLERTGYA